VHMTDDAEINESRDACNEDALDPHYCSFRDWVNVQDYRILTPKGDGYCHLSYRALRDLEIIGPPDDWDELIRKWDHLFTHPKMKAELRRFYEMWQRERPEYEAYLRAHA
jgi:hypothetical protein